MLTTFGSIQSRQNYTGGKIMDNIVTDRFLTMTVHKTYQHNLKELFYFHNNTKK
jgi:hypothetical protein